MSVNNISLFPSHPASRARNTLDEFIGKMQVLAPTTLGVTNWDSHVWDMTGYESSKTAGKSSQKRKILFTQLVGKENKVKAAEEEQEPFAKEFADLVKAFAVNRQHANPKTKDNHMVTVRAFRYLYQTLEGMKYDPLQLTNRHFMEAINLAAGREADSSAYRVGVALGEIADTLDRKKLTSVRLLFKNPIKRPMCVSKNTPEAKVAREKALPSLEVFEALGKLANMDLPPEEAIIIRVVEILLITGFRINEVLELATDCLKMEGTLALGQNDLSDTWYIAYRPRKAGDWDSKTVPDILVPLAQRAIDELTKLCKEARHVASFHERVEYKRLYPLRKLDPDMLISGPDIENYFGCTKGSGTTFVQSRGVEPRSSGANILMFRVGDIENALLEEVRKEPLLKNSNKTIPMSKALIAVFRQQFHAGKFTLKYAVEPLQLSAIQDRIQGRPTIDMPSIFDKYGFMGPNGESLSLRTHQPRHWLSTIAEEGGHLSPVEIARFFGRKNITDNQPYDHNLNPIGDTQAFAEKLMSEHGLTKKAIQDFVTTFPLLDWEAAVAMADELGSTLITDIGLCQSDYSQSPCTMHLACLRGCGQYRRQKGNKEEVAKIKRIAADTSRALQQAEEDVGKEAWGANNWARHHLMIIQGCGRAIRVEYMNIPDGTIVQVFPKGETYATGRTT